MNLLKKIDVYISYGHRVFEDIFEEIQEIKPVVLLAGRACRTWYELTTL